MDVAPDCGRIVWAEVADANGAKKLRPCVIVSPSDQIATGNSIRAVAVSTRLPDPLPADHVLLPWHANGHPKTRLNRPCAAVCSWVPSIEIADIADMVGIVPPRLLIEILEKVERFAPRV